MMRQYDSMKPNLADLSTAIQTDDVPTWLSAANATGLSKAGYEALSRIITHDSTLWAQYPDSMPSCLLARTLGISDLTELRAAWLAELEAGTKPWVCCLHPLRLPEGLLSTLPSGARIDLSQLERVTFLTGDTVAVEPFRLHPTVRAPEDVRQERLVWNWRTGETSIHAFPEIAQPASPKAYPQFEDGGWGPLYMVAEPGAPRVDLPRPRESGTFAQLGRNESTILVYGSLDEYDGGFVWIVQRDTLQVIRKLTTYRPVWSVHESQDGSILVARTSDGVACWAWWTASASTYLGRTDRSQPMRTLHRRTNRCLAPGMGSLRDPTGANRPRWLSCALQPRRNPPASWFRYSTMVKAAKPSLDSRLRSGTFLKGVRPTLGST